MQAHHVELFPDDLFHQAGRDTGVLLDRQGDVFRHGQGGEEGTELEEDSPAPPELLLLAVVGLFQVHSQDPDRSRGGFEQHDDLFDQDRFSRAAFSQNAVDFTGIDMEIDAVVDDRVSETGDDVAHFDDRFHGQ